MEHLGLWENAIWYQGVPGIPHGIIVLFFNNFSKIPESNKYRLQTTKTKNTKQWQMPNKFLINKITKEFKANTKSLREIYDWYREIGAKSA